MSGAEIDDQSPWGTHAPDALGALMLALTRNTPLGRGGSRAFFRSTIEARQQGPLDCEIYGRKIRGYLSGNRCEWKAILNPRLFDPLERKLTARMLARDKAVFLDIGANIGVHSLAALDHARPDARIVAFEPHPLTYRRLAYNFAQANFPGLAALNVALGDAEGFINLSDADLSLASTKGNGLGPQVRMRPLADCLAELGLDHIDIMKIDVEGAEDLVLGGFARHAEISLLPELVIIEHLGRHLWSVDVIELLTARGLIIAAIAGNNTLLAKPGSPAQSIARETQ